MIAVKTPEQIELMRMGGAMLAKVLSELLIHVKPGVSELAINDFAEKRIRELGGEPGFRKVKGYNHAICVATNEIVVHGIPTNRTFQQGDVVCIDCGVYYKGFHTDMAETILVSDQKSKIKNQKSEKEKFLEVGKRALHEAIKVAIPGNRIGHISQVIQGIVEGAGYSVVRNLIGHGVGRELHEEPDVPGFLEKPIEKTPLLKEGMTIAIEVIYNMGGPEVTYASSDGWTIRSADRSLSAVFERSVVVKQGAAEVLTR